jgi:predicted transposase/invertase (TIGR01784 family)
MEIKNPRINEQTKLLIKQAFGIDVGTELLSPISDYIFKRIFTADEIRSKVALIKFINSVIEYDNDDPIIDLTIINPEIPVDIEKQKKSIFDIRAKCRSDREIIIEMQKNSTPAFAKRSQHIISKAYASQEISGMDFTELKKCYLICVTNFNMITTATEYMKDDRYRDRQGNDLSDDETIIFIRQMGPLHIPQ